MTIYDIIKKKRDGLELESEEIRYCIAGCVSGIIPDYQLAALLMAIFIRGMNERETADLTMAIARSGAEFDLGLPRAVDKHSTGGVGDTTTLIVAPIVAACGVPVAKMTGRGLGHTGGTVDKLESIPGLFTALSMDQFRQQVASIGLALICATTEIAPADKILYALRDVTATVDSIPLIASSIMSKKIAAGATHIVLDVKFGRGAFMPDPLVAQRLAAAMVNIGKRVGRPTTAVLTSMDQPLGNSIGNALEVKEALSILSGTGGSEDLRDVSLAVATEMLLQFYEGLNRGTARMQAVHALESGLALRKFKETITAQGGDLSRPLPTSRYTTVVRALDSGYVTEVDSLVLGKLAVTLGAGRLKKEDSIDYGAGMVLAARVGDKVSQSAPLVTVHSDEALTPDTITAINGAFKIGAVPREKPPLVLKVLN